MRNKTTRTAGTGTAGTQKTVISSSSCSKQTLSWQNLHFCGNNLL